MQIFKKIISIVVIIILLPILFVSATILIDSYAHPDKVPSFFGWKPFIVLSGSMETQILAGDVVVVKETETQNFTRAGTMFALTTKIRASAVAGRKEELYAALKENGCGDLVYETVNANSLSAFVKEQIAENQDTVPEWLSGLVHVYEQTSVSVRQSAK